MDAHKGWVSGRVAMLRKDVLRTASRTISVDRAQEYGDAEVNFKNIAALWSTVLGVEISAPQVALCLNQLKVARLINNPSHVDSWVDAAGYIALGAEIATGGSVETEDQDVPEVEDKEHWEVAYQ